jgi:rhodanese-related sulfurtransferase
LLEAGFPKAVALKGGLMAWQKAGGKIVSGAAAAK